MSTFDEAVEQDARRNYPQETRQNAVQRLVEAWSLGPKAQQLYVNGQIQDDDAVAIRDFIARECASDVFDGYTVENLDRAADLVLEQRVESSRIDHMLEAVNTWLDSHEDFAHDGYNLMKVQSLIVSKQITTIADWNTFYRAHKAEFHHLKPEAAPDVIGAVRAIRASDMADYNRQVEELKKQFGAEAVEEAFNTIRGNHHKAMTGMEGRASAYDGAETESEGEKLRKGLERNLPQIFGPAAREKRAESEADTLCNQFQCGSHAKNFRGRDILRAHRTHLRNEGKSWMNTLEALQAEAKILYANSEAL
jgi:hypothetical protein